MLDLLRHYLDPSGFQFVILLCFAWLGVACGLLSPLVVANRMAFFSDAVAHSTLAGVALGLLMGVNPVFTMVGMGVCVALIVGALRQQSNLSLDTLLGVALAGALAVGVILYSKARDYTDLHGYLFGRAAFLTVLDLGALAFNALAAGCVLALFGNRMALISVSRSLAQARGVRVGMHEYLFIVLLGLVVSLSVRAVGLLLVNALLVVPAATSRNLARSFSGMVWGSLLVSLTACVGGLIAGDYFEIPNGPAAVAIAVGLFVVSQLFRRQSPAES